MSRRHKRDDDIENMDEEEFNEYLQDVTEQSSPKYSSVACLAIFGGVQVWRAYNCFTTGSGNPWISTLIAFLCFVGAGLLLYRILR
jgi:hypothetical protein